ncbi:MAG: cell wall-binding repeat-containing protein [Actinomycetota bacterium]|nr:cell wall-binding repeat-containing protein [Actinomycetota bacterium]
MPRAPVLAVLLAALGLALAGCGGGDGPDAPQFSAEVDKDGELSDFAALSVATRATTRLGGPDPPTDAASVASAVFPATSPTTRPTAVTLVDRADWQGAVAASVLGARPLGAPVLLGDGGELPDVTETTLKRLAPRGSAASGGAQVIVVGPRPPAPKGFKAKLLRGPDPYATAATVDRFSSAVQGKPSANVVVASGERAAYAMPAAAWAARSGDSVLFAKRDALPPPTVKALRAHEKPRIFILGPETVIGPRVEKALGLLGRVERIEGRTPVENAVEFARYDKRDFGWGITRSGDNFTLASVSRPADAGAAAALASNGVFAPLLLTDSAARLPPALEGYLLDVQPGFYTERIAACNQRDTGGCVYNRVWILGDAASVSPRVQGRLDEISAPAPIQLRRLRRGRRGD